MRNSSTLSGKELAREIARLQAQLEELSDQGGEVIEVPFTPPSP